MMLVSEDQLAWEDLQVSHVDDPTPVVYVLDSEDVAVCSAGYVVWWKNRVLLARHDWRHFSWFLCLVVVDSVLKVHLSSSSPVFIGEVHLWNLIAQLPHKNISACVDVGVGGCIHVHFVLVIFSTAESFLEFFVFIACAFFFFLLFLFARLLCFVFFALSLFLLSLSLLLLFLLLLSNDGFELSKSYSLEI